MMICWYDGDDDDDDDDDGDGDLLVCRKCIPVKPCCGSKKAINARQKHI